MIHGYKIKIKSLRENLKEVGKELFENTGELRKGKGRLGFEEWNRINRLNEQLLKKKERLKSSINNYKRKIKIIKQAKAKKKR